MNRRKFLEIPLLSLPLLVADQTIGQKGRATSALKVIKPVLLTTWDMGVSANAAAWPVLKKGGKALDAVEAAGRQAEDEVDCCVGLSANPDRDGHVTLDACIMDGNGDCGAVSFLERIKHPISVARKVMETTPHVFLTGEGAQRFAVEQGFPLEEDRLSPTAEKEWKKWLEKSKYKPEINIENRKSSQLRPPYKFDDGTFNHDTRGTVAIDSSGKLAGMVTTSGMAFKMRGRVGDSPIIGAGLFVDNEVGAATSSGTGEEVIRICGSHTVVEQMRLGRSPEQACREAVRRVIKHDPKKAKEALQVGFLAISRTGEIGAFAIQKGFTFTVTNEQYPNGKIFQSKYVFDTGVQ